MSRGRWLLVGAVLLGAAALALRGCGDAREMTPVTTDPTGTETAPDDQQAPASTSSEAEPPAPAGDEAPGHGPDDTATVVARVRAVSLSGAPLPGMLPVATTSPNAFEEPVATGPPTDAAGWSQLTLPPGEQVYLRAWAPNLDYFANNYFTIPAMDRDAGGEFTVTMARASVLRARVFGVSGAALAGRTVELMMHHPTEGPWWPSRARTDASGRVTFEPVPPGEFRLEFTVPGAGSATVPGAAVRPGGSTQLGKVQLRP